MVRLGEDPELPDGEKVEAMKCPLGDCHLQTNNGYTLDTLQVCPVSGTSVGPLMGGTQYRMSILRSGKVACLCRLFP